MAWVVARWRAYRRYPRACARSLPAPTRAKRIAIFVPAWGEVGIVGRMLRHMLSAFDYPSFRIFVGCYPNDPVKTNYRNLSRPIWPRVEDPFAVEASER
jgi:hypothetical protein